MTAADLAHSAATDSLPPPGLSKAQQALWLARAGRWDAAHDLCQEVTGSAGAWIHAWLHRQEGDLGNADYWYGRAGKPPVAKGKPLEQEWWEIAEALAS